MKKGAIATALVGGSVAAASGSAAADEVDAGLSVLGEGEFSVRVDADEVSVLSEGVFTDVQFRNGAWVIEGRADGTPIDGGSASVLVYGHEELISEESDPDANLDFTVHS